jgi:hypothetical protein
MFHDVLLDLFHDLSLFLSAGRHENASELTNDLLQLTTYHICKSDTVKKGMCSQKLNHFSLCDTPIAGRDFSHF